MKVTVAGWRFLPHSYSVIAHWVALELTRREQISLAFEDVPPFNPKWRRFRDIDSPVNARLLESIPPPTGRPDVLLRLSSPFDVSPSPAKLTAVLITSEFGQVFNFSMRNKVDPAAALQQSPAIILTPSRWSRAGLLQSGARPENLHLWPHGVQPEIFAPASEQQRLALRREFGFTGFVFLHVGAMTPNKGIDPLLKAFAAVAEKHPDVRLVLKGSDSLYASSAHLASVFQRSLSPTQQAIVEPRLLYSGNSMSFSELARLYQAADAYVTPYLAEGFNMPALEALASGLPVICTSGGSTDDFASDDVALRIRATLQPVQDAIGLIVDPDHLVELMVRVMEDRSIAENARIAGPAHVAAGWTWRHCVDRLLEILGRTGAAA